LGLAFTWNLCGSMILSKSASFVLPPSTAVTAHAIAAARRVSAFGPNGSSFS
jgi:hypothetical protein